LKTTGGDALRPNRGFKQPADELDLVERARCQDPIAIERLISRYHEKAFAVAYRACSGDVEEAKDLTQEAFLKAFRNLRKFSGNASFYTWLYQIVVNTCLDAMRRKTRRKKIFSPLPLDGWEGEEKVLSNPGDTGKNMAENPLDALTGQELRHRVQEALRGLSENQRMVFELKVFEERSIGEISRLMNSAEGTVKSHLFRATQHVRKALGDWVET